jgi:SH3-like domain-containing protein
MAGATAAAGTGAFTSLTASAAGVAYRTTAALNLRSRPSIRASIIMVLPAGAKVIDYDGEIVDGYRSVDYNGTVGWVSNDFLVLWSSPPPTREPVFIGSAKTTANVNFRATPGGAIFYVVKAGTWVDIYDVVENGYRYVVVNGKAGWIADAFLGGSNAGAFITTARVNLRMTPSTSGRILMVIPKGATVVDYDGQIQNGYRGVDYLGTVGWVSNAFLTKA